MPSQGRNTPPDAIPFRAIALFLVLTFGIAWGILAAFIFLPETMVRLFGEITGQTQQRSRPPRKTETIERAEFGEVSAKRLQPVLLLGIGVTPPLKTDLNGLAICRHPEINGLRQATILHGDPRLISIQALPYNTRAGQQRCRPRRARTPGKITE